MASAEGRLFQREDDRGHLDPVTELGIVLKRPIPKGQKFIDWIADEKVQVMVTQAWLSRGFSWEEIRGAFCDLTRWQWLPEIDQLQHTLDSH